MGKNVLTTCHATKWALQVDRLLPVLPPPHATIFHVAESLDVPTFCNIKMCCIWRW